MFFTEASRGTSDIYIPVSDEKPKNGFGLPPNVVKLEDTFNDVEHFPGLSSGQSDISPLVKNKYPSNVSMSDVNTLSNISSSLFANYGTSTDVSASSSMNNIFKSASQEQNTPHMQETNDSSDEDNQVNEEGACDPKNVSDWTMTGDNVVQIDGLQQGCDLSLIEELIASFGTVEASEIRDNDNDNCSVRFR